MITVKSQNKNGGKISTAVKGFVSSTFKEDQGTMKIAIDAYEGKGETYQRRKHPIIYIENDGTLLFVGTMQQLQERLIKQEYYILSIKHTEKNDPYISLWGPNSCGYTQQLEGAGVYHKLEKNYHNTETNVAVPAHMVLNVAAKHETGKHVLLNEYVVWEKLGLAHIYALQIDSKEY